MKLKAAFDIVISCNGNQRYLYPHCIEDIERRIKILRKQAEEKAKQEKLYSANRRLEKAQVWESILIQNKNNLAEKWRASL